MHPSALSAALAPLWQTVTSVDEKKQMSKKDLLIYAQGAFDIDDETHNRLMEEVKDEKVQLTFLHKVENILKGRLDSISSPSVKIQIMGGKVCLRCKCKILLGIVNNLFVFKSLLTTPSNVLPLHLSHP